MHVNAAEGRLGNSGAFLRDAFSDMKRSPALAKRFLLLSLARQYRYSSAGVLSAFAPAIGVLIVFTLARRAGLASGSTDGLPPQVFAVFGIALLQTFLDGYGAQRSLFAESRRIFGRRAPLLEAVVLARLAESALGTIIRIAIVVVVMVVFGVVPAVTAPLAAVAFFVVLGLGAALGLALAPWCSVSRDISLIAGVFPWMLFGFSPVFFRVEPPSVLAAAHQLNPLTWVIEPARAFVIGSPAGPLWAALLVAAGGVALFGAALVACRLAAPYVAEHVLAQ